VLSGFLNGMILMGVGPTLLAPLPYALATLRGMRHKRVYPNPPHEATRWTVITG